MSAWTRLTEPGPTLLIVVLVLCPLLGSAAPFENDQSTEIEYYPVADATGCYYNFEHYDEGDRIITNEPCLNCTCHNRMLMCYLRVCPFTKAIGQDCKVEKRSDQCCPIITCPEVPVHLVPQTSTPSTALGHLNEYGCSIDNLFYADGAKVPSNPNNPCEVCYCIRNKTACIIQECTLTGKVVEGCRPVYIEGVCCPVRYDCDHPEIETTSRPLLTSTTTTTTTTTIVPPTSAPSDCIYQNQVYIDGALVKKDVPCEKCYCMRGDIICAVQECGPTPLDKVNCTALPTKEGQCCPDTYDCEMISEEDLTTLSYYDVPTTQPTIISSHSVIGEEEKSQKPQEDVEQFVTDNEIKLATEETTATITTKITEAVTEIVESITSTIFGTTERPQEEQISEKEYVKPSEETKDSAPQKETQYSTPSKDTENEEKQQEKETEKPISRKEEQKPEKETVNPSDDEVSENSTLPDDAITKKVTDAEHDIITITEESVKESATESKKPDSAETSEIFPVEPEEHITTENILNEKDDHSFDDTSAHDDSDAENNEISENDVTTDQSKLPSTVVTGSDEAHTRPIDQKNIPSQEDVTIREKETTPIISETEKPDSEQSAEPVEVPQDENSQSPQVPTDGIPSTEEETSKISSEETTSSTNTPVISDIEKSTESPDVIESLTKKSQEEGQNKVTETPVTIDPKKETDITEQPTDGNSVNQSSDDTVVDALGTTEIPIKSETPEVDVQPNEENQEKITEQAISEIGVTKSAVDEVMKPISYDMVTEIQSSQNGLGATEESISTEVTPKTEVELTSEVTRHIIVSTESSDTENRADVTETSRITEIPEGEKPKPVISSHDAQTTTKKPEEEIEIVTGISMKDTEKPQSMDHVSETTSFEIDSNEIEKSSELPDVVTDHFQVSQVEKQSKPSDPNEKSNEIPTASEKCTEERCVEQVTSEIAHDEKSEDKTSEIVTPNLEEGSEQVKPSEVVESTGEPENETESYDQKTEKPKEESSSEKPEAVPTRATETSTTPTDIYQTYKPDVSQIGISVPESEQPTENSEGEVTDKSTLSEKDHAGENQTELPEIPAILVTSEITSQPEPESEITESPESEHKSAKKPTEKITTEPPQTTDRIELQEPEIPNISDQNVDSTVPSIHEGLNEAVPEHPATEKSQEELKPDITPNLEEGSGQVKPSEDEDGSGESENETEAYDQKTETPKEELFTEKPEALPTRATETSTTPTDVYQTTDITQHGDNDESGKTVFESTQSSTKTSDLDQVNEKYFTSSEVTVEPVEKVVFTLPYNKESEYTSEYPEQSEVHKPTEEPNVQESESTVTEEEHGIPGEGSCLVDGQTYKNNTNVPPFNQCQLSCKCVSSILQCESVQCMAPPSNLEDCMPVFHSPGSCCPTYSCSVPSATSVIESDSHIIETTDQKIEKHETTSQSARDQTTIATTSTKNESEEKITESFTEKESEEPTPLHDDLDNEIPDEHFEEHHVIPEHCGEEGCSAIESQTTEQAIKEKDETETKKYSVTESSSYEKEEKHTQQPVEDFFNGENPPTVTEKKDSSEKEGTEFSLATESIIETQPKKEFANAEMTSSVTNVISTTTKYDINTEIPSVPEKYPMEDMTTSKSKEPEFNVPELSTVRQSSAESEEDNESYTKKTELNEAHDEHHSEGSKLGQETTILPITNTDYESLPKEPTLIKKQETDSTKVFGESTESVTDISSVTQPIQQEGEIPDQKPQKESSSEPESVTSESSKKGHIFESGTTQSTSDESVFETTTQMVKSSTELKEPTQNPELSESTSEDENVKITSIKPGQFEQVTKIDTSEQKQETVDETEEVTTSTLPDFVTEIENSITSKPLESADHMTDATEHGTKVPEQSVYDEKKTSEMSSEKSAITEPYPVEKEEIVTKYLEIITDQPEVVKDMSEVHTPVTEEAKVQSTPSSETQTIPDREAVTELHHGLEVATDAAEPGTEKNVETKPESETIDFVTETSSGLEVSTETQPEVIEHVDAANELQPEHIEHDLVGTEAGPESEDTSKDSEPKPVVVITETPSAFTEHVDIVTESRPVSEEVPTKEEPKLSEVITESQPEITGHSETVTETRIASEVPTEGGTKFADLTTETRPEVTEHGEVVTKTEIGSDVITENQQDIIEVSTEKVTQKPVTVTESQSEITERSEIVTEAGIESGVTRDSEPEPEGVVTETQSEVTEVFMEEKLKHPVVITETQPEISEVSTEAQSKLPEIIAETQTEITEISTREQSKRPEVITELQAEITEVPTEVQPKLPEIITVSQPETTQFSTEKQSKYPEVITELQAEITEVSTEEQPKLPEITVSQSETTEVSTEEKLIHPEIITEIQPSITEIPAKQHPEYPEVSTEEQPKIPEIITVSQSETTEVSTEEKPKHPEIITEIQPSITEIPAKQHPEYPEVSTDEQPKIPEIITVSQSETTEVSTEEKPKHPEIITETQPSVTEIPAKQHPEYSEVSTEEEPKIPEIITESQQETTAVTTEDQPKLPEIITESTEISIKERPEYSEVITETQLKNTEVFTSEQPEHSQVLGEVQPESTPVPSEERPYHPEIITETQSTYTEVSSEEHSKNPELITEIQPEITEVSTTEQPEHPEINEEILPEISSEEQPKQPEIVTEIHPEITEVSTKEQPKYPEVIAETKPEINEISTEEESVQPEMITEIQPHTTEVSKEEQSKLPEMVTQSQPETTEISTEEQPKHPVMITETHPEMIEVSTEEKPKHPEIITETQPSITEIPAKQHPEYPEIIEISSEEEPKYPEIITETQPEIITEEQSKYPEIISESQPEITDVATEEPKHSEINDISTEKQSPYPEIITNAQPESIDSTEEQPENPEVITETQPDITEISTGKQYKHPEIITETQPSITEDPTKEHPKYPDVVTEIQPEITEVSEGESNNPDVITESLPEVTEVVTEEPKHPEMLTDSQPEISEISTEKHSKYPEVITKAQTESTSLPTDEPKYTEEFTKTQSEITEVSTEEQPKHPEIITETQPSISEVSTKEQHKKPEIDKETQSEISEVSTQEQPKQPETTTETKPDITEISTEAQAKHPEVITETQPEVTEHVEVVSETLIGSDVSTEVGIKSGEVITETLPEIPKINLSQDQFVTEIQPGSQEVLTEKELEYYPEITEISIEKQSRPELGDLQTESHPSEVQPESEVSTTVSNPVEVPTDAHDESEPENISNLPDKATETEESVTETRPVEVLTKAHPEIESVATETYPKPEMETSDIQPEVVTEVHSVPAEVTIKAESVPEIFETFKTDSPKEVTTESFVQVEPLDDKHKQEQDSHVVTTTDETFTSPHPITQSPRNDSELYTSGPKEEYSTKKFIEGELSTSVPLTSSKPETPATTPKRKPSHEIPGEHEQLPELPDYQSPVEDYDEDDQSPLGPGTCRYGGKVFVSAQQIPRDDPCDFCFCFRSDIICLQQSCPPPIPNCHEEPIRGFCCPRYECPVGMATSLNLTTTTTTTTTTLPPHFLPHAYKGLAVKNGCQIRGQAYRVGDYIKSASGPCMHCTCGADGQMKCDPKQCSPEPMLRQMIAAAASRRRR